MKEYFECNLPKIAPKHVKGTDTRKRVNKILKTVHSRMAKLNSAWNIVSQLKPTAHGEQFAVVAKTLFDSQTVEGLPFLDSLSAEDIADYVVKLGVENIRFSPRYDWPNALVVVDTAFLSTPEWEAIRLIGLGGSDAAVTMDLSPYRTQQELYHDKVGTEFKAPEIGESEGSRQFRFSYGHKVESLVIEEFCRRTGATVIPETRMFAKKGMPYITANIDAIVLIGEKIYVFEAKTTGLSNKTLWDDGKVPPQYVPQCVQYMTVLNDERVAGTYIACIYGNSNNDFVCSFVERLAGREAAQLEIEKGFWNDYVLQNVEPESSGDSKKDLELYRKLIGYADKSLPSVVIPPEYEDGITEYMELLKEKKTLNKKVDGIEARLAQLSLDIVQALGTATKGRFDLDDNNYLEISYSPRSYTRINTEKLRLVYPEIYQEVVNINPENSRVFSIKEKTKKNYKKTA